MVSHLTEMIDTVRKEIDAQRLAQQLAEALPGTVDTSGPVLRRRLGAAGELMAALAAGWG